MSFQAPEPPPTYPAQTPPPYGAPRQPNKAKGLWGGILAALVAIGKFFVVLAKPLFFVLKFAKLGMLTGGTMLLSIWAYSLIFGWKFALGFVICIFIHEMGHVFMAWREGLPVSAPIFIPYMGAMIMLKQSPRSTWIDAVVGIGGPLFGTLSGLACWGIFSLTGSYLFLGLAYMAFMLNLFNLTPIYPLDGGRIVGAISHWIWIAGLLMMITMFFMGIVRNPLIWILIIMSIPQIWSRFKNKNAGPVPATNEQRLLMGAAYIGLASFLFWAMSATNVDIEQRMRTRSTQPIASVSIPHHVS